jgi:hypothetical protein
MFWPLIGAFVGFVLLAVLIGWWIETSGQDNGANSGDHH